MEFLFGLMIAFHILVSALLIVVILLQPGRGGGGMGAVFGGGSSTSIFGGRGATTVLSKATGILAAIFMVLSVAIVLTGSERSVVSEVQEAPAPAAPAPAAPAPQAPESP